MTTTARLFILAAIAAFCWLVLIVRLTHACEITPADWAEVEGELSDE